MVAKLKKNVKKKIWGENILKGNEKMFFFPSPTQITLFKKKNQ